MNFYQLVGIFWTNQTVMPKTPSTKLFHLIKSLSGPEKRYFKLFATGNRTDKTSKYLQLFDAVDAQEVYDDDALREIVYEGQTIQSRKFSELKAYLYDLILKSLQGYDEKSSIDFRLKNLLQSVRVLYKRSHYEDGKELLQKVKKLAYQYESYSHILEILNWEKQMAYTQRDITFLDSELERIDSEEKACLEQLRNLSVYRNIFFKIFIAIRKDAILRSEEQRENLQQIINHSLLEKVENARSHRAKVLYYRIFGLYYYATLDYQQFYEYSKTIIALMESQKHFLKEDVSSYIGALSNYSLSCGLLGRYDEVEQCLEKFQGIVPNTRDDEQTIYTEYYGKKFALCISTGEFSKGVEVVQQHLKESKKFDKSSFQRSRFYFQYFYVYFGIGDYDKALEYLNKWLNLPRSIERQDLQSLARILNLLIHFEMGNNILLDYLFRSTYRFLRKRNRIHGFEKSVLDFIRETNRVHSARELRAAFIELKNEFIRLSGNPSEKIMLQYFDFVVWLDSKINGQTFAEAMKAKYEAQQSSQRNLE